jgi:hypothetical protein
VRALRSCGLAARAHDELSTKWYLGNTVFIKHKLSGTRIERACFLDVEAAKAFSVHEIMDGQSGCAGKITVRAEFADVQRVGLGTTVPHLLTF